MNGTEPVGQYALRPMPDDFEAVAAMPVYKLMRMFRARRETIQRWIRACGIEPGPRANLKAVGAINLATVRNWSDADDAAAKLRKFGPVHRCDEQGRFDIAGHFWRAGWAILTDAEIIERANRRRAA